MDEGVEQTEQIELRRKQKSELTDEVYREREIKIFQGMDIRDMISWRGEVGIRPKRSSTRPEGIPGRGERCQSAVPN
jgi:hypothetical protein